MQESNYVVVRAQEVTQLMSEQIGAMMPALSESTTGQPIPVSHLQAIVDSSDSDLLLAVSKDNQEEIGGVAVINLSRGVIFKNGAANIKGWLEDFVVSTPRQGIGSLLWNEIIFWCSEREAVVLNFTSNPKKAGAHKFYLNKPGVTIRATGETAYFSVDIAAARAL